VIEGGPTVLAMREMDELAGALLHCGQLQNLLSHCLDTLSDTESYQLVTFLRHLPIDPATMILNSLAQATQVSMGRLFAQAKQIKLAVDELNSRIEADEADDTLATFDSLVSKLYPEAKDNGL
jgi:hypothetical protein